MKIDENHLKAAECCRHAADCHERAAKHHREGDHEIAAHHAQLAYAYRLEATDHAEAAARQYAAEPGSF
ncbi:MAG TPA: hypothetical protein VGD78_06570 [Chthoniobacterales bacterium]